MIDHYHISTKLLLILGGSASICIILILGLLHLKGPKVKLKPLDPKLSDKRKRNKPAVIKRKSRHRR
jgi:uncharacterized membrane protein YciS (DUF1049 family)